MTHVIWALIIVYITLSGTPEMRVEIALHSKHPSFDLCDTVAQVLIKKQNSPYLWARCVPIEHDVMTF